MGKRRDPEPPASDESCLNHSFERGERVCRQCGHWFCDQCVVTPWGPRKPALCVECAIGRGGVRSTAGKAPVRSDRQIRQIEQGSEEADEAPVPTVSRATSAALQRAAPGMAGDHGDGRTGRRSLLKRLRPT